MPKQGCEESKLEYKICKGNWILSCLWRLAACQPGFFIDLFMLFCRYCRLCAMLHHNHLPEFTVSDINEWWNPKGQCTSWPKSTLVTNNETEHILHFLLIFILLDRKNKSGKLCKALRFFKKCFEISVWKQF